MASISLFNSNSLLGTTQSAGYAQSPDSLPAASASSQPEPANATATSNSQNDTVKLSEAAQAKLLYSQGQGVSTIAKTLGTTTKEVNNDLGITLEKELEQTLEKTESAAK